MKLCPLLDKSLCTGIDCEWYSGETRECVVKSIPTLIRLLDDTRHGIAYLAEQDTRRCKGNE